MTEKAVANAVRRYLDDLHAALGCVTQVRLSLLPRSRPTIDSPFGLSLQRTDAVPLRGEARLLLRARQWARVVRAGTDDFVFDTPLRVQVVGYSYQLSMADHREVLAFHWTPDAADPNTVTFPHLRIGPAILGDQTTIRPRDLHKAHVPTGYVSLAAVVRLAVTELGVAPMRPDWDRVLRTAEDAERGGRRLE